MKIKLIPMLLVLILSLSITTNAVLRAKQVSPSLSFSGKTATCQVIISGYGIIDATMELWHGKTLVASWSASAFSSLLLLEEHSVISGYTYTLSVSGTIDGVPFTGSQVSKTCP